MTKSELKSLIFEYIDECMDEYRYSQEVEESNLFIESLALECDNFNSLISSIDNSILEAADINEMKEKARKFGETIKTKISQLIKKIDEIIHYWTFNIIAKVKSAGKVDGNVVEFTPFNINYTKLGEDNETVAIIKEPGDIERMMSSFSTTDKNNINKIISITKNDEHIECTLGEVNRAIHALNNERRTIKLVFNTETAEDMDSLLVILSNISKLLTVLSTSFKVPYGIVHTIKTGNIYKNGKTGKYFYEP